MKQFKFILSGGGTVGHINPALAIAKELRFRYPNCKILFVGAKGRMEMKIIPSEGFKIIVYGSLVMLEKKLYKIYYYLLN